jgi:hypothetical protein
VRIKHNRQAKFLSFSFYWRQEIRTAPISPQGIISREKQPVSLSWIALQDFYRIVIFYLLIPCGESKAIATCFIAQSYARA